MTTLRTNIFRILNLGELNAKYRLYRIRGLSKEQPEYYQNKQLLIKSLSYALRTPATITDRGEEGIFLVVRDDAGRPESPFSLVRTTVYLDPTDETHELDFTAGDNEDQEIAARFLNFMIQNPLSSHSHLWQPGAGRPFFEKCPLQCSQGISHFQGFSVRVIPLTNSGLGLCVDVANKYVQQQPLPMGLTRPEFRRYKGRHCIYHYGHKWYEIQLREFADVTTSEYILTNVEGKPNLLEFIGRESQKPIPQELASLSGDASVVLYSSNRGELRAAPAALCFPVLDSFDTAEKNRPNALLAPHQRYSATRAFVEKYLQHLRFSNCSLKVSIEPEAVPSKIFFLPDYEFGNGTKLSVRGTQGAKHVDLDGIGKARLAMLRDPRAGFYVRDPLQRQYLILPQSVQDGFGPAFTRDLIKTVAEFFPHPPVYSPEVVTYNDRLKRNFVDQGNSIIEAVQKQCSKSGYAVVMIHETEERRIRQHDQLGAMVIRKLREFDICASVIHSEVGHNSYKLVTSSSGQRSYLPKPEKQGRLSGYLRNVALNKVLLTNERWPFALATPLHADLIVGIDVKQNTAGFTLVNQKGDLVRTIIKTSNQKERLLSQQVRKMIVEVITAEANTGLHVLPFASLAIHRDGILWNSELTGLRAAIGDLKTVGILAENPEYAFLELPKNTASSVRVYDVEELNGRERIENPQIGVHFSFEEGSGYICATGRAFPRRGTVQPVHIKRIEGNMTLGHCQEDVFFLTGLTWTRPEDCAKDPITIKLTDRRLGEDAESFDADALEFYVPERVEEVNS